MSRLLEALEIFSSQMVFCLRSFRLSFNAKYTARPYETNARGLASVSVRGAWEHLGTQVQMGTFSRSSAAHATCLCDLRSWPVFGGTATASGYRQTCEGR